MPGRVIVALTDQRLLVFSLGSAFAAQPRKLLYSIAFDAIAWLPEPESVPGAAQALRVQVGAAGQGVLGFEFPGLKVNEGRNMVNRLRRALPSEVEAETETPPESAS